MELRYAAPVWHPGPGVEKSLYECNRKNYMARLSCPLIPYRQSLFGHNGGMACCISGVCMCRWISVDLLKIVKDEIIMWVILWGTIYVILCYMSLRLYRPFVSFNDIFFLKLQFFSLLPYFVDHRRGKIYEQWQMNLWL